MWWQTTGLYDSIIRIHIMRSDSLHACTCGGLHYSAKSLPMGLTLPRTRLAHDHLGSLSCQRLEPFATLTTWISLLYVGLTDSLDFQDATLLDSLSNCIHYNTTIKYHQEFHGITSISYHIHVSHTKSTFYFTHYNFMPMPNQPTNS